MSRAAAPLAAHHALIGVLVAVFVLFAGRPSPAAAAGGPPIAAPAVDASGPRLPAEGERGLGLESARLRPGVEARLSAFSLDRPLVWRGPGGDERAVLSTVAGAYGSMSATVGRVRVAMALPVFAAVGGDERATGGAVGDPGLDLKLGLLDRPALALAALARGTAPLGASAQALGSAGPTGELGLVGALGGGPWSGAFQLGYRALPQVEGGPHDASGDTYDDRLRVNLGLCWSPPGPADPALSLELLSERQLNELGRSWRGSPAELLLGGQLSPRVDAGPRLHAGLGLGLSPGVGASSWRLLLGLGARAPLPSPLPPAP